MSEGERADTSSDDDDNKSGREGEGDEDDGIGGIDSEEFLRAVAHVPDARPTPAKHPVSSSERLEQLGQFRILGKIGSGGMGVVYRAQDEKLRRVVALKLLQAEGDEAHRRRFLREARVAAAIAHPNVATIHEVGEAEGRIYIAMELVTGVTLREKLEKEKSGAINTEESLRIARDVARGVAKAHALGITHRDLKPDNVMLADDGSIKVLDFGLAKPMDDPSKTSGNDEEKVTVTQEGRILGTPGYMSPEQATGRAVDIRTDVFAIGVMLYEMLTGVRPFKGSTSMETLIATSRDAHAPLAKIKPSVPAWVERIVDRCLEKDAANRFGSAKEVLSALDDPNASAEDVGASRPSTMTTTALTRAASAADASSASLKSGRSIAIGAVLVVVVAVGAWWGSSMSTSSSTRSATTDATGAPNTQAPASVTSVTTIALPAIATATQEVALAPPSTPGFGSASLSPSSVVPPAPSTLAASSRPRPKSTVAVLVGSATSPASAQPPLQASAAGPTQTPSSAPGGVIVKSPY